MCATFVPLAALELYSTSQKISYRRARSLARKCLKILTKAAIACPVNFADKKFLVLAALASVEGDCSAMEKYTCAISLANKGRSLSIEAIANERAARHLQSHGEHGDAEHYLREAMSLYIVWGAKAKVDRLQKEIDVVYGNK